MPKRRRYLPRNLTKREKRSPKLRIKLARCIKSVEIKQCPKKALKKDGIHYDYDLCDVNPVAICRSSLRVSK